MGTVRDHEPVVIESFNGLWARGDAESCPLDHFTQADNIQFFNSGFETRYPLDQYQDVPTPLGRIVRIYNYTMQTGPSFLVLVEGGSIYHGIGPDTVHGPILTVAGMEDFGFVGINGRAYITPFKNYLDDLGKPYQLGIENEFVYVYKGDGVAARKAAGPAPTGGALVANFGAAGLTDIGFHIFAVVYETDTGYLTALGPETFATLELTGTNQIDISNIPTGPAYVSKRHIVATRRIVNYNNDQDGYQFYFVPEGNIDDNVTTTKTIEFFDIDLIADASHLIDNFPEIPSCVNLTTYHSRMVCVGEYGTTLSLEDLPEGITDNRSVARVSWPGEPEAISQVDGLIIAPLDGNPLTNAQEFRDILYLFKQTRTYGYSDNEDVPASWSEEVIDQGVGAPVHGVAAVLDSGGVNIDYLLVADWSGLMLFNGTYARPELSWKIEDWWFEWDRDLFNQLQIVNDSLNKKIWFTLPTPYRHIMMHADYGNGLDAKNIRWARWLFDAKVATITLIDTDKLIVGALENAAL